MTDMTAAIQPKADELAADHLLSGPMTITITSVEVKPGAERPVTIWYENDNGLPFRPCKSVSRIFVAAWGPDASKYTGKRATLYRDASVKWGGMEVGGIRISHMSDIARDLVLALTATKGKKALTTVKPMPAAPVAAPQLTLDDARAMLEATENMAALEKTWKRRDMAPFRDELAETLAFRKSQLTPAVDAAADEGFVA